MKVRFLSLASGSSGNCYYLGTDQYGILIDAGISPRKIKKALVEHQISSDNIQAVFITHDHADHIKAVSTVGEKWQIPVYATTATHRGICKSYCVSPKLSSSVRHLEKGEILYLEDFRIEPFEVPHDATDSVGFYIEAHGHKIVFLTDMGHITPTAAQYIEQSEYIVIESNYDAAMLQTGPYPFHLKQRVASNTGHMDNLDTGRFLASHFQHTWKHIWLCHLSKENNTPQKAYDTLKGCLTEGGIEADRHCPITVLRRDLPSEMFFLE